MVTRIFILLAFLACFARGDGYFRLGGGAGVPPDLTRVGAYSVGTGDYPISNDIADALVASGMKNGKINFPSNAPPGVYVAMIFGAQIPNPPIQNGFIVMTDENGIPQASFIFDIDAAGWTGPSNGSPEIPIALSSADDYGTQVNQIAGAISSNGFGCSVVDNVIQFNYGNGFIPHPAPTGGNGVNMIVVQQGGFNGATRYPAIQTLLDRGWTLTNYK